MTKQTDKQTPSISVELRPDRHARICFTYHPGNDAIDADLTLRQWGHRLLRMSSPRGGEWSVGMVDVERLTNARGLFEEAFNAVQGVCEEFCAGALSLNTYPPPVVNGRELVRQALACVEQLDPTHFTTRDYAHIHNAKVALDALSGVMDDAASKHAERTRVGVSDGMDTVMGVTALEKAKERAERIAQRRSEAWEQLDKLAERMLGGEGDE